jgi:diacylglycerol O-acyltransferase / wax synthase
MPERLSSLDVSFLYLEEPTTAMHVGSVMLFQQPEDGLDFPRLLRHVETRIALVPRYRQRLRPVPGRLANPVWVDHERFDITEHVRSMFLPRPGTMAQLEDLVARLQARRLDRDRPLWELAVVDGLEDDRFAVITKVHQAMVDGVRAVDLGQVVLDEENHRNRRPPAQIWRPAPEPTAVELLVSAVTDSIRRPRQVLETLRAGAGDVRVTTGKLAEALGGLALAARTATSPPPRSPLNREVTSSRRFATVDTSLEEHRWIHRRYRDARSQKVSPGSSAREQGGHDDPRGDLTAGVDDVMLAVLAGALRSWLLARGEPLHPSSVVRALVPVNVPQTRPAGSRLTGGRAACLLIDLPTGEPSPLMRLHHVAWQTRSHREAGYAVDAPAIAGMAGFAPATLHSLGARMASGFSRHLFNLVVTNVPGPSEPLYLTGDRMLASYPVIPLARSQALAIGLTSYDGGVYYGLNADRQALPDLGMLATCVRDSLGELKEASG